MDTASNLEQLITEGIKGLPAQYLSEVADFVVFIRRRAMEQWGGRVLADSYSLSFETCV